MKTENDRVVISLSNSFVSIDVILPPGRTAMNMAERQAVKEGIEYLRDELDEIFANLSDPVV